MRNMTSPTYYPMGDQAIVAQFENELSITVNKLVQNFSQLIKQKDIMGIEQLLPGFNNLTISYNPSIIKYDELVTVLRKLEDNFAEVENNEVNIVHIPVVFGGEYGLDLVEISKHSGLSPNEVVDLLTAKPYYIYLIGFIAGYPYCGDLDARLCLPRRSTPRLKVNKGTVQIANQLTGIFTLTAPSGWHLLGWTPMDMFNPYHEPPTLLSGGNYIQYVSISAKEAEKWDDIRQREWDQQWNLQK